MRYYSNRHPSGKAFRVSQGTKQPSPVDCMDTAIKSRMMVLTALALVSFPIKALLAFNTFGTNDSLTLRTRLEESYQRPPYPYVPEDEVRLPTALTGTYKYEGIPLYDTRFNHPPFVISLLRGVRALSAALKLPFHTTFRLFTSLADSACFLFVCLLMKQEKALNRFCFGHSPSWLFARLQY